MKKLVAFVMAMAITAMAFGQMENIIYPGVEPVQDSQDRTGWIGGAEEYDFKMLEVPVGGEQCSEDVSD